MKTFSADCFQEASDFYSENGFCILYPFLSGSQCHEFLETAASLSKSEGDPYAPVMNPHRTHPTFAALLKHPAVVVCLEKLAGTKVDGLQSMFFFKKPGSGGMALHQDNFYTRAKDPGDYMGVWIPFEDADEENGGLIVCPGSHREPVLNVVDIPGGNVDVGGFVKGRGFYCEVPPQYQQTTLETPAGSAVFMHGHLIHGSAPNSSTHRFRRVFASHYIRQGAPFVRGNHAKREIFDLYS